MAIDGIEILSKYIQSALDYMKRQVFAIKCFSHLKYLCLSPKQMQRPKSKSANYLKSFVKLLKTQRFLSSTKIK